jgi:hypothetical protein
MPCVAEKLNASLRAARIIRAAQRDGRQYVTIGVLARERVFVVRSRSIALLYVFALFTYR